MSLPEVKLEVVMLPEGTFTREIRHMPIDVEASLTKYTQNNLSLVTPNLGNDTYLYFTPKNIIAIHRMRAMPFRCHMATDDKSKLYYPTYLHNTEGEADTDTRPNRFLLPTTEGAPTFTLNFPDDMSVLFIVGFKPNYDTYGSLHLLSVANRGASGYTFHHPPLPNIYDNGSLCDSAQTSDLRHGVPGFWAANPDQSLFEIIMRIRDSWLASEWNADLNERGCSDFIWMRKMLSFCPKSRMNVPELLDGSDHWTTKLRTSVPCDEVVNKALEACFKDPRAKQLINSRII